MNKKINVLALAAAACGVFAMTSCKGSTGGNIVTFVTDDLRNYKTGELVKIKPQTVKTGKLAKAPNYDELAKTTVRYTYKTNAQGKVEATPTYLQGFSYDTEDRGGQVARRFDFSTPITKDTILYPIYSAKPVYCLTLELKMNQNTKGTWNKDTCYTKKIWEDNWFEEDCDLSDFQTCIDGCIVPPTETHHIDKWTYIDESTGLATDFNFSGYKMTGDLVLTAHYTE